MKQTANKKITHQLHRIKGQLDGVEGMIQACRSCDDVVMQLMAARSSIEKVMLLLLEEETDSCVCSNNKADRDRLKKLTSLLFKYT